MNKANVKPFVFVLMPFNSDFDDIYHVGIKAACLAVGAYCERVDEQIFAENILDRVYNQIAKADIVISEMTGRNPNVFYETGYAHALNKRVILLTQNADDIPFDLKHYPHIVYGGKISHLKTELERRVKWYLDNPGSSIAALDLEMEFLINGATWQDGLEIEIPYEIEYYDKYGYVVNTRPRIGEFTETGNLLFSLQIGFHNVSNSLIDGFRYHLGLVAPKIFAVGRNSNVDTVTFKGEHAVIRLQNFGKAFPDDWNSAKVNFSVKRDELPKSSAEFTLKLFSEVGAKEYQFRVSLIPADSG